MTFRERVNYSRRQSLAIENAAKYFLGGVGLGFGAMAAWAVIVAAMAMIAP